MRTRSSGREPWGMSIGKGAKLTRFFLVDVCGAMLSGSVGANDMRDAVCCKAVSSRSRACRVWVCAFMINSSFVASTAAIALASTAASSMIDGTFAAVSMI